jgi:hypothetical protein
VKLHNRSRTVSFLLLFSCSAVTYRHPKQDRGPHSGIDKLLLCAFHLVRESVMEAGITDHG